MSGIDTIISFNQLLNVPLVTSLLGGGGVWRYQRPLNSPNVDVVVSMPEYVGGSFNTAQVEINVHAPNIQGFEPIGQPDPIHPDVAKLKTVTNAVLSLLGGYTLKVAGKVVQDADGHWYSNIVVIVGEIDQNEGIDIQLFALTSVPDGYGGSVATDTIQWSGKAAQQNIASGSQININAGRYEFNLKCDWLVPDSVTPQKNWQLRTDEGVYVINGIKPEVDSSYWRLSTARKSTPYG